MGLLTFDQIVTEGMELGGNTGLTARASVWLQVWLRRQLGSWKWPHLPSRYGPYTVAQGVSSFAIGNGTLTADKLIKINRVMVADTTNNGLKGEVTIYDDQQMEAQDEPLWQDVNSPGLPKRVVLEPLSWGWTIRFDVPLDKAYRFIVVAQQMPVSGTGSAVPPYPNDETMIQAVFCQVLRHQEDPRLNDEEAKLRGMEAQDRVVYGRQPTKLNLARSRFRPRR